MNNTYMIYSLLMNINNKSLINSFKTTWNMTTDLFTLYTQSYMYNSIIDWGDGTLPTTHTTGNPTHTYTTAGTYQISISGSYPGFCINNNTISTKLLSIDNWGNVNFKSFENAFKGCTNLVNLPKGSINIIENVTNFNSCFSGCTKLTTIPNNLFDNCINVTNFSNCFNTCTSLTSIPLDLFKYNVNVTNFSYCFYNCKLLTTIPNNLFDNCINTIFINNCFTYCSSLTSIPTDLFKYNVNNTNFYYCFANCTKITSIPTDLFIYNTKVTNFSGCFMSNTSILGNAPSLWTLFPSANGLYCFRNDTTFTNYASIPTNWK